MLRIAPKDPQSPDASALLDELSDALAAITGTSGKASFDVDDVRGPRALFVVAHDDGGRPVGCGAIRPLRDDVAEVKRMYARPGTHGVGTAVLRYLEEQAMRLGYAEAWLETRRVNARAVGFYRHRGYVEIPSFGKYVGRPEAICLGKVLAAGGASPAAPPEHRP